MTYSAEAVARMQGRHVEVVMRLNAQVEHVILLGERTSSARAKVFLQNGVARRLRMLRHCLNRVFEKFPPDRRARVEQDDLFDVMVYLQAFVTHVAGTLDNWAWAFLEARGVVGLVRRESIGLFKNATQNHLTHPAVVYLNSDSNRQWHADYQKNYRDALMHRIPLYVPPFELTDAEAKQYRQLDEEIRRRVLAQEFDALDSLYAEQEALGRPSFRFVHSFGEHDSDPAMLLHPQMLADAATIVDLSEMLIREFPEPPRAPQERIPE